MKNKNLLIFLVIIVLNLNANAQKNFVGQGTKMIMGLGNFSSVASSYSSDRINSLAVSASYDHFYRDNMFVGLSLNSYYQNTRYSDSAGAIALGPELGYAFGNQNSKLFPFVVGGCGFQISESDGTYYGGGINFSLGLGIIIPIQNKIGIVLEGKYDNLRLLGSETRFNTISFNFGIVGLIL